MTWFTSTVTGLARIGRHRELKRAIEGYWAGATSADELSAVASELRLDSWRRLVADGHDSIPVNTFSLYDQVLDTTVMLGALPERYSRDNPVDAYFAAARGDAITAPWEMTKWFDTNYHYIVPEIDAQTQFSLNSSKVLQEVREALSIGAKPRPVVIGPITYLLLSKAIGDDTNADLLPRTKELLPVYSELLNQLHAEGVEWVQIDEPALVQDRTPAELEIVRNAYDVLSAVEHRPRILVSTYFDELGESLPVLAGTAIEGIGLDLVYGSLPEEPVAGLREKLLVAGVVDGRNVWRTNLDWALDELYRAQELAREVAVSTSCSLLHVPYSVEDEDVPHKEWLAFGDEKSKEVANLALALRDGIDVVAQTWEESRRIRNARAADPVTFVPEVRQRVAKLSDGDAERDDFETRVALQNASLGLPPLPTTTIGSFPQTPEIRRARRLLLSGEITAEEYEKQMRDDIRQTIELQEELGLDVLVHGEPERNDMVQYFAEQLDGYWFTHNGWVQSYGTRCVRPPILVGDCSRSEAMTVKWTTYAASLTQKPVKGMLTGPVTMLAWSFVRDDLPIGEVAKQVALAIRDETLDLERAGIKIIQVDEPAIRELLPLRNAEKPEYLHWSVTAFRIATSGVESDTQIHTHMCYSEFGELVGVITDLDADVTSVEAARSRMEILTDLAGAGFALGVGPGVYDIHSPRVPSIEEVVNQVHLALAAVPVERLWINPDCGLKTRRSEEVIPSLSHMVKAAQQIRSEMASSTQD